MVSFLVTASIGVVLQGVLLFLLYRWYRKKLDAALAKIAFLEYTCCDGHRETFCVDLEEWCLDEETIEEAIKACCGRCEEEVVIEEPIKEARTKPVIPPKPVSPPGVVAPKGGPITKKG